MSDHPAALNTSEVRTFDWNDHATILEKGDGSGFLDGLKVLHRGTLAQMVAIVAGLSAGTRDHLVIQKAGDQRLEVDDILELARRADFPLRG